MRKLSIFAILGMFLLFPMISGTTIINNERINTTGDIFSQGINVTSFAYNQTIPAINEILSYNYYNLTDFDISDYYTAAEIEGFGYYNSTDFDINDYSTTSTILDWNYYNSTDFDINDYYTSAQIEGFNYYNSSDFDYTTYFNNIANFTGTLTDSKICTYNSATGKIDCDYTDSDTTYTSSGTLLDLTGTTFSLNEGTLTDGKLCTYVSGTGLVCNSDDSDTTYTAGTGLSLIGTEFSNTDTGSSAVSTHESTYNHDNFLTDITAESIGDLSNVDLTGIADNKILKYNSGTSTFEIADDLNTEYTASGTLLDLTSTTFSLNEGILTDGKGCKFTTTDGIVCDQDFLTTVAYTDLTGSPSDVITAGTSLSWSTDTLNVDDDFVSNTGDTMSGNLVMGGVNSNIELGSNYLSGDGDDEGIYVDREGRVGVGTVNMVEKMHINGNLNMTSNNVTSVDCITWSNGGKWCSA